MRGGEGRGGEREKFRKLGGELEKERGEEVKERYYSGIRGKGRERGEGEGEKKGEGGRRERERRERYDEVYMLYVNFLSSV